MKVEPVLLFRETSKDLVGLPFDLLLFPSNQWDDIIQYIQTRHTRVSRAAYSLECSHHDCFEWSECQFQSAEGDDYTGRRAVGVGYEVSLFQREGGLLMSYYREMRGVDGRDDKGDEGVTAVVLSVGKDYDFGTAESVLCRISRQSERRRENNQNMKGKGCCRTPRDRTV